MRERSSRTARLRLVLIVVCIAALAGACGRKGNLDPPPSASADQSERDEDR